MLQSDQFFVERNMSVLTHFPSTTKIEAFPRGGCLIGMGKGAPMLNPGGSANPLQRACELGEDMTFVGLNDLDVVILDPPVGIQVVAEISARDRLTHLVLHLGLVSLFDCSIGVRITGQKAKSDIAMWLTVAINVLHPQNNILGGVTSVSPAMRLLPSKVIVARSPSQ